ncbi:MAG: TetR/AcrR family transcriptional regulator [Pseudomonadota bacterium]
MPLREDTRAQLLDSATRLFASRGFYGASLANIAEALGLTKQALLHHFGRKEKLYAEVLSRISNRMLEQIDAARAQYDSPQDQLLAAMQSVYAISEQSPHETRIIVRELLDSERRTEQVHSWYLQPFLDSLVDITRVIAGKQTLTKTDALTKIYPLLGAMSYFIVSDVVLEQMYGQANYRRMRRRYPDQIQQQVYGLLNSLGSGSASAE